ncbi:MAG: nickel pincer cofactor biosynthesis protein LarC [Roseiflexaceae bacterium]|nr:nickel pincer cofactor biosynthesis protein LarC [Roseiflexaceae bacterium]
MTKSLYFDCFSGISGDMALGALLDVGLDIAALRAELAKLPINGWTIGAERGMRGYLSGTRALVDAPEGHVHRHLSDIHTIIEFSGLTPAIKQGSLRVFSLLAEAEGSVHGIPAEEIHFHEVGALDAIIDIVGVVAGLHLLGVTAVYASPVPLGSGWARAAHGALPIPAPATIRLLAQAGAPVTADMTPFELTTPTGAALLAGLASFERPPMRLERVGYGLGARDLERPNALRVWLGTSGYESSEVGTNSLARRFSAGDFSTGNANDSVVLLETNIDDQPAEQLAYVADLLLAAGALDVWQSPIFMKKGRLGSLLHVLVPEVLEDTLINLLMRETTTLGVRRRLVERHVCEREIATIETALGPVQVKRKLWRGEQLGVAPEYVDCARLAREHGLPLQEVYAQVALAVRGQ